MIYTFRIGDSCNHGHGHYTDYYIELNMIKSEIEKIKPEELQTVNPELKLKILKKPEIINTPYLVGYGVFYN